ncbi:MAG TPA: 2Fe-2S iron-sulfur cluster-binding protein, partial [Solirubrobacteraceae bacterium]|nr:2Fe-2S iron-sulfur cluster-binding protein [Solirubrobacteraceae bacterium]
MKVRFEPIGEEIECASDETVLDAAFRQGLNLAYGCREGQCSACKCFLMEGEVAMKRYSNFALSDSEQSSGYSLMCRAMPEQDLVVELLHYDPENYRLSHEIRDGAATVEAVEALTSDITRLVLKAPGFDFTPGQFVDVHVPGVHGLRRSFSLANIPGDDLIELMIKRYPGGKFSGLLEDGTIKPGDELGYTGPYGSLRPREGEAPILMIAGGSGMAPILSLLRSFAATGCERPIRFFYGARTEDDLFHVDEIRSLAFKDFMFTPVVGGFVHEAVDAFLASEDAFAAPDVYMCGPPPMVEAAESMLIDGHKLDEQRLYIDKFTTSADAAPPAEAAAAAPPVKRVDDGAPAGDDSERQFSWYRPNKRRATLYEDVTVDTQPSVFRHLTRGWPVSFEDGRGTWNRASTALESSDWFEFRDPGEQWERPFYQRGTAVEQQIEGALKSAAAEGLLSDFSSEWIAFLHGFLQIPAYVEHGLWFATATAARDCLSDSVTSCVCLQAAMKQRSAQAIVLYAMDLEREFGVEFPIESARDAFLNEPAWQPTRAYLERLAATPDWGEVVIAANLCFEPLVGTLIRRELGIRAAAANGDTVTPVLARVATQEWEWIRAWTLELVRFLYEDPEHGPANRAVIERWVEAWRPRAVEAAAALAPLAPAGVDPARALAEVQSYADAMLTAAPTAPQPRVRRRTRARSGRHSSPKTLNLSTNYAGEVRDAGTRRASCASRRAPARAAARSASAR